jgi:hypothetical protein
MTALAMLKGQHAITLHGGDALPDGNAIRPLRRSL